MPKVIKVELRSKKEKARNTQVQQEPALKINYGPNPLGS